MTYQPPPTKKSNAGLWIGAAAILLVALVAVLLLLLNRQPAPAAPAKAIIVSATTSTSAPFATPTVVDTPTSEPSETSISTPMPELGTSNVFIEYILDASGSMTETLSDGSSKIEVAKRVLTDHMRSFRPETNIGLRAYGHRLPYQQTAKSCQDIELIAPVEKGQMERIVGFLQGFIAQGMTPLAASLQQAKEDFDFEASRVNSIVMLSDGIETCGGDPCQLVEDLKAQGINFTIHVIGLDVDDPTRQQLSCIAQAGGGTYHDAMSQQDLGAALGSVKADVTKGEVVVPPGVNTPTPAPTPTATPTETPVPPTPTATPTNTPTLEPTTVARPSLAGRMLVEHNHLVYSMNADGSDLRAVTSGSSYDVLPRWSPDGRRIVFTRLTTSGMRAIVSNADGSDQRVLVNDVSGFPDWSPAGDKIALTVNYTSEPEIGVINADGSGLQRLTNDAGWNDYPAWSPDGQRIAYSCKSATGVDICVMNADGSNSIRLVSGGIFTAPRWSPDGSRLVFEADDRGNYDIYVVNSDGTNLTKLISGPSARFPTWSPDGKKIAFSSTRGGLTFQIWVVDSDGKNPLQVSVDGSNYSVDWRAE